MSIESNPDGGRRPQFVVFGLLFLAYVAYYFCRVTFAVTAKPIEDHFGFTKTQIGWISSYYFTVYALGKLVNGFVGARLTGKKLLLIGLGGTVLCNVTFAASRSLRSMTAAWSANAFFQSMGWIALISVIAQWFSSTQSGKTLGLMSVSYLIGDGIARASAGTVLSLTGSSWSAPFIVHAILVAFIAVSVAGLLKATPEGRPGPQRASEPVTDRETEAHSYHDDDRDRSTHTLGWLVMLLTNPWFGVVCLVYFGLSAVRYAFFNWSIVYLIDETKLSGSAATYASAVFPLAGCAGAIFAGWISDRMQARRGPVLTVSTLASAAALYLFVSLPQCGQTAKILALGLVGFTVIGPYSLVAGAMAVDFGSKRVAATAAGIIDAVGALAAAVMGAGMGAIVDVYGWQNAFLMLVGLAFVTAMLCASLWGLTPVHGSNEER